MSPLLIDFAGNDYLGLARDPRLAAALSEAAAAQGISATSSRWGLGWTDLHEQLECDLAAFFGAEAACLLGQAFLGGLAWFTTVDASRRTVYCDEQSHANLTLGMQAAGLAVRRYRHCDPDDLERRLRQDQGGAIIASDAVFGISGRIAPLTALRDLSREFAADLLLDDAHGVFALGPQGRGALEAAGVQAHEATLLGSLGKALGCAGGFLVGSLDRVERLRRCPAVAGSTPLAIPLVAAAIAAIRIVRDEPERRERLQQHAVRMRQDLLAAGLATVACDTPILAAPLGDVDRAMQLADHFARHGLRIPYFPYASEPRADLLRMVARSCYTPAQLDRFSRALADRP
ncbi:aminotransferase class I/II-fold pyridoxal phosphate-dependent enzyme [Lignipirellula cremea]|uniref:8-amino-7-oxononanoate synthase n=1 Tax=Lignipirellula cremea TaxID=2528010 RepID=A0A518E3J6_9BACT|nr:pyridoxal phosphate-dependent aminotransferase family protein [Lignipirellula cremea]QDU98666.1 8-amino-7-oxononanoate synthase [Lignipirellula cremea]